MKDLKGKAQLSYRPYVRALIVEARHEGQF